MKNTGKQKSLAGKLREYMPTCKEVTMLVIKEQDGAPLSFRQKFNMYFHVYIVCRFCRLFYRQSAILHKHIHHLAQHHQHETPEYELSQSEKASMQAAIDKENRN